MECAIDSAAAAQLLVRRVDDGIGLDLRDVALHQRQLGITDVQRGARAFVHAGDGRARPPSRPSSPRLDQSRYGARFGSRAGAPRVRLSADRPFAALAQENPRSRGRRGSGFEGRHPRAGRARKLGAEVAGYRRTSSQFAAESREVQHVLTANGAPSPPAATAVATASAAFRFVVRAAAPMS